MHRRRSRGRAETVEATPIDRPAPKRRRSLLERRRVSKRRRGSGRRRTCRSRPLRDRPRRVRGLRGHRRGRATPSTASARRLDPDQGVAASSTQAADRRASRRAEQGAEDGRQGRRAEARFRPTRRRRRGRRGSDEEDDQVEQIGGDAMEEMPIASASAAPAIQNPGSHQAPPGPAGAGRQGRARQQGRGARPPICRSPAAIRC